MTGRARPCITVNGEFTELTPATYNLESSRMRVRLEDFDAAGFSLHEHPVLVLENFWSPEEMTRYRGAMQRSDWITRGSMEGTAKSFPGCGNWGKAAIQEPERDSFLQRVMMPFVTNFVDSFEDVVGRVMSFNYFNYGVGDCLSVHSDTRADGPPTPGRSVTRRIAVATYFHDVWDVNWGGELIIYDEKFPGKNADGASPTLEVRTCISPDPGSLVFFTVPRIHRVSRVDPFATDNRRLSIAGWFMTDHG